MTRRSAFRFHLALFVAVQVVLVGYWELQRWLGGTGNPWFLYVLVGWGIVLAAHYALTRGDPESPAARRRPRPSVGKTLALTVAVLGLLVGGVYLFLARPWSSYSLIDMLTLFEADKQVHDFQHMDQVFPSRPIGAAPAPLELPRRERPLWVTYRFGGEEHTLGSYLRQTRTTGLLVVKDGTIVHARYYLGAGPSTRFTSWSMAKSFVGTLVGQALAEGRIHSLDDPISAYVPALLGTAYDGVPIRDVLEMASGIDFNEDYGSPFSDINLLFVKLFALGQSASDVMDDYGRSGPPGVEFHYASINTQALGMLVSAVYRQPLAKVLEDRLWHPLGAGAAYWNTDESGTPLAFCCINARLQDFARLGLLYLHGGLWRGRRLLPASWVREATTPRAPFLEPGALSKEGGSSGYGYQWWVLPGSRRAYAAEGLWGQYVYVSVPDHLVIVRTAADPAAGQDEAETFTAFRAIAAALRPRAGGDRVRPMPARPRSRRASRG